jgi:photosystem II stability/assembly factor-like uncharacterized protein
MYPEDATVISDSQGVIGWGSTDGGRISVSTDGADTWTAQTTGTTTDFKDIQAVDRSTVYAVGSDGLVMKTFDGGSSWYTQAVGVTASKLYAVAFGDTLNGWAAGKEGTIIGTSDGGLNWIAETSPLSTDQQSNGLASCTTTGSGSKAVLVGDDGVAANNDGTFLSDDSRAPHNWNTATSAAISVFLGVVCTLFNFMLC